LGSVGGDHEELPVLFRIYFYVGQCTSIAFVLFFALILGGSLLENGFGVVFGPVTEAVLTVLFYGVMSVLIGGCSFGAALAIYFVVFRREWKLVCPLCGTKGELENDKKNLVMACPDCGEVGGRLFWDWSIRVYPLGNPTRDWRREADFPLEVDLDQETFCGVRLGESAAPLRRLGPVEFAPGLRMGSYMYFSQGLEYGCDGELLESYSVYEAASDDARFLPFSGRIRHGGELISLAAIDPLKAVERFGEPFEREAIGGVLCLYYQRAGMAFDLEFDADGRFGTFSASRTIAS
jgi:hypothetical protein